MLTSGAFGYLLDYVLWWLIFASLVVHTWCFFKFFPWQRRRKSGLVIGNALVLLCMLGIVALAFESYFRFVCVETDAFGVSLPARRWFVLHTKLNSLGCRDVEWTVEKPPGVRRIAFVGDSITYGWGIKRVEDRFTDRIGAMFDHSLPGSHEVMNVAKPGWGTKAQLTPIQDLIRRFGVDDVILCYVPNDIDTLLPTTDEFDPAHPPEPFLFDPDRSCLLDYVYRTLYLPRVSTVRGYHTWLAEGYADKTIWRHQREQLDDIIRQCRDNGVRLRVVLLPFIQTAGKEYDAERLHATLGEFFETRHVQVLDLLAAIAGRDPDELVINRRDAHPNERAHRLFADAIWEGFFADSASPGHESLN